MTAARRRAGLGEMVAVVTAISDEYRANDRARVKAGEKPIKTRVRRADVLDDIGDLLSKILVRKDEVARALRGVTIRPYGRDPDPPPKPVQGEHGESGDDS